MSNQDQSPIPPEPTPPARQGPPPGSYIAIGIAVGVALGAALDNLGLGIALGVAIGAAIDAVAQQKRS